MKTSLLVSGFALFSACAAAFDVNQCGPTAGNQKCKASKCCSKYGWCGTSVDYCLPKNGCQSAFGRCSGVASSVPSSSPVLSGPAGTSKDKCGRNGNGLVCAKGYCCSQYGYCGKTDAYCSAGCQTKFGSCLGAAPSVKPTSSKPVAKPTSSKAPIPAPSKALVSNNARCGAANGGRTCAGSQWGDCCSSHGWCGSTKDHCKVGCQSAFGICNGGSSSSSSTRSSRPSVSTSSASSASSSSSSVTTSSSLEATTTEMPATPSAPVDRILLPKQDMSIDRTLNTNLDPSRPLTLFYGEASPGTYTMLIKPKIVGGKAILLENIAGITGVTCNAGTIYLEIADIGTAIAADTWPAGTVLFTLTPGCNSNEERGVYVISSSAGEGNIVQISVTKTELKDVVEELDISYGQLVSAADGQQMTSYTTTVTSYYTNVNAGTMTSSTFVSTVVPSLTTMTYTSTASGAAAWETLTPDEQVAVDDFLTKIPPPGEDGKVSMVVASPAELPPQPLGATINNDPAYQAELQSAMEAHGFDSPAAMNSYATSLLAEEGEGNVPADSPVQLETSSYAGTPDEVYDSAPEVVLTSSSGIVPKALRRAAAALGAPRTNGSPAVSKRVAASPKKRADGWEIFWGIMGNDAVGEACDLCALASGVKDLYDVGMCFFAGKGCPKGEEKKIDVLEGLTVQEYSLGASLTNGRIFSDSRATVLCVDCRLEVSSLRVEGSVKIIAAQANYPKNAVLSASFTASQSSVSALVFNMRVKEAGKGSFDRAISTWKIDSLTVPSVFTISPVFLWAMGLTYDTETPIDVQAGAVLTTTRASAFLDVKEQKASDARNWQPKAKVTYPTLAKAGKVVLTPYIKTDIQLSLTIFGAYMENAAVLTTQTNMGFDASVLEAAAEVPPEVSQPPSCNWWNSWMCNQREVMFQVLRAQGYTRDQLIAAGYGDLVAAAGWTKRSELAERAECAAGSLKLNSLLSTKSNAVIGGKGNELYNQDFRFGWKCLPIPA